MLRVVLIGLGLMIMPLALYAVYERSKGRRSLDEFVRTAPWLTLFAAGLLIVAGVFYFFISFSGDDPGGVYKPAVLKDGKIEPGHFEKADGK